MITVLLNDEMSGKFGASEGISAQKFSRTRRSSTRFLTGEIFISKIESNPAEVFPLFVLFPPQLDDNLQILSFS